MHQNTVSYELSQGGITLYGAFNVPSSEAGDGTVENLNQKTQETSNVLREKGITFKITKVVTATQRPDEEDIPSIKEIKEVSYIVFQLAKELFSQ